MKVHRRHCVLRNSPHLRRVFRTAAGGLIHIILVFLDVGFFHTVYRFLQSANMGEFKMIFYEKAMPFSGTTIFNGLGFVFGIFVLQNKGIFKHRH